MIRWYLAAAGVVLLIGLYRTVAIGRKRPLTLSELKTEAWGGMPVAYRITQPRNRWKLRLARKNERRRSA